MQCADPYPYHPQRLVVLPFSANRRRYPDNLGLLALSMRAGASDMQQIWLMRRTYRASLGPDLCWDALCATIVSNWEEPSWEFWFG